MDDTQQPERGVGPFHRRRVGPSPQEATEGENPLEDGLEARDTNLFPFDVEPHIDIGGGAEEQGVFDEEFRR